MDHSHLRFAALAGLACIQALSAQTFQKGIGGRSLIQTADGGYAHCDRVYMDANSYDITVTKLNSSMAPVWKKTYNINGGNYEEPYVIRQAADGGYFVGGGTSAGAGVFYSNVLKLEDDGDVSWHYGYSGGNVRGIHPLADSGAIVAASVNGSAQLYRLDKSGAIVWGKDYTLVGITGLLRLSGGGYGIVGFSSPAGQGQDMLVMRVDDTGAVLWAKAWGGTDTDGGSYSLAQASDGGLVVIGSLKKPLGGSSTYSMVLVKFALADGQPQFQKRILEPSTFGWGISVDKAADNGFFLITADGTLIKTDANGVASWGRRYSAGGDPNYYTVKAQAGGGALIQTFSVTALTDADGNAGCTQRSITLATADTSATLTDRSPVVSAATSRTTLAVAAASASLPTVSDFAVQASKTINVTGNLTFCGAAGPTLTPVTPVSAWSTGSTDASLFPNASGSFWADVLSSTGCSARTDTVTLTSLSVPAQPGAVAGKDTVCKDETAVAYSIAPVSGATSYAWSATGGASLAAASTTVSAAANFSSYAGTLTVNAVNSCGTSALGRNKEVTVIAPPGQASISGTSLVCRGQTGVGFKAAGSGFIKTYAWTVPAGATIRSGQGTDSITVDFGDNGGSVTAASQNQCGTAAATSYPVTLSPAVTAPAAVTGPSQVCARQQGVFFSTDAVAGATGYAWTLPPGATFASSSSASSVNVNFGDSAGTVKVAALFACGQSATANLAVSFKAPTPAAGTLSGPASVCAGARAVAYSVSPQAAVTAFSWTVPSGSTRLSPVDSAALKVDFGSASGNVTVTPQGACGDGAPSTKAVTVHPLPAVPTVTVQGARLISSEASAYKWTRFGEAAVLATTREFDTPERVMYVVTITDANGCTAVSDVKVPGFPSALAGGAGPGLFLRFAGSAEGVFIPFSADGGRRLSARLVDAGGRLAWSRSGALGASGTAEWSADNLERGVYTLFLDLDGVALRTLRVTRL